MIYLELGYEKAKIFIEKFLLVHLKGILEKGEHIDAKSHFQEIAQDKVGVTPLYQLLHDEGPDHDKMFTMGAYIDDRVVGKGKGGSKQQAEQEAAKDALKRLKW